MYDHPTVKELKVGTLSKVLDGAWWNEAFDHHPTVAKVRTASLAAAERAIDAGYIYRPC